MMCKHFTKEKFRYPFYVLSHPMDGFYEIRHRDKGSVPIAILIVILCSITYTLDRIWAGFVVNDVNPRTVDLLSELQGIIVIFFLFCIANWSVTCLMNGEGRFKDIVTAVGYSLLPMILCQIPAIIISRFVAQDEEAFYYLIVVIGTAWTVIMMMVGIMTVHNYSLGKTLFTLFLTMISILIILFIYMMLTTLLDQVYMFFYSIYLELLFRG
jgi:hypothetical protein